MQLLLPCVAGVVGGVGGAPHAGQIQGGSELAARASNSSSRGDDDAGDMDDEADSAFVHQG
jgi:hypothetical protein